MILKFLRLIFYQKKMMRFKLRQKAKILLLKIINKYQWFIQFSVFVILKEKVYLPMNQPRKDAYVLVRELRIRSND